MKPALKKLVGALIGVLLACGTQAGSLTNNFTSSFDFLADGVVFNTNWDGVYLNAGDILGGTGSGRTLVADANNYFPGFLTVQGTGGAWVGNESDSFFIYKVVAGDFDASVVVYYPFDNSQYHLPGLMARAFNPNGQGTRYSTTSTNSVENWIYLARFQEYNINEHVRYATNGADVNGYIDTPGDNSDTNSTRYLRLTRVGDVFTFYDKTNQADAWNMIGTLARPDLDGVAMQVGIKDESGTGNSPYTYFTDFELSGTNVTFPTMPAPPTTPVTTATNINGSLTFAWTTGNPTDSSLVVMSRDPLPIRHNPVQGVTYAADQGFGSTDALLGGSTEFVVYNGTGTSVTVSNLGPYTVKYHVAVYEYSGSGSATVYNTANPATNYVSGPGIVNDVSLGISSTVMPVGGAVHARLLASFSTGQTNIDVTTDPLTVWSSSNTGVFTVGVDGTATAVGTGSATLTGTYGGTFVRSTNVTVNAFIGATDNFTSTNNYLTDGLVNSMWDGLFLKYGDVPGGAAGNDGPGVTTVLDSQITSTNGLTMNSVASTWQGGADDGPFLFKIVPGANSVVSGDFQAAVHINSMNTLNGVLAGLMARLYNPANGGGPAPGGSENHVNYWKAQNGTTSVRQTAGGTSTTLVAAGPNATDAWLLMERVDSTNFYFFEKVNATDPWTFVTNSVLDAAAGDAPMEVGLAEQTTIGVEANAVYDSFWLDAVGLNNAVTAPPPATGFTMELNPSDLSMTLNWVAQDGVGNPVASIAVMSDAPIAAQPLPAMEYTGNSVYGQGSDLGGGNYVVFVSANPPASINNTVTVTGLKPGVTYYAAVYTFGGTGSTTSYNVVNPPHTNIVDGVPLVLVIPSPPDIPVGGIGSLQAEVGYGYTNAVVFVDRSSSIVTTSSDTNVTKVLSGVLTAIANGSVSLTNVYTEGSISFTNVVSATNRSPTFTDNFTVSHDYLNNGITGTPYDGLYIPSASAGNPVPGSTYVPLALSGTSVADANTSSNGVLTVTSAGDGWEGGAAGGFFLFKYVPGDFQMAIHINSFDVAGYNQPGLMARAYGVSNNLIGAPFGYMYPNANGTNDTGEYWVSLTRFDEFGIGTYARLTRDGGVSTIGAGGTLQNIQLDQGDANYWLLIVRSKGTEFDFYKRLNATDPWRKLPNKTHYSVSAFAGEPMQVGIMGGPWTGTSGAMRSVGFDHFMLDTTTGLPLQAVNDGLGNIVLSWPADPNAQLESTHSLTLPNWQPVAGTPTLSTNGYTLTLPIPVAGYDMTFFRLKN